MKRALLLILHLLLMQLPSFSQKEGYIGIFGMGVGLDFNYTPPGVLVLSYTAHEQFYSVEGTAAISDQEGNLLFYTDGANVWNRNHVFMSNGEDIFPYGFTFS